VLVLPAREDPWGRAKNSSARPVMDLLVVAAVGSDSRTCAAGAAATSDRAPRAPVRRAAGPSPAHTDGMSEQGRRGQAGAGATGAAQVRTSLLARRAAVLDAVAAAERDYRRIVEASRGVATDDEHDPDGAGLAIERALIIAALARARAAVRDLDRALARLAGGSYGVCETCARAVGADRLVARPAALRCIECAGRPRRR
jgi:DnaK suppressor protein